MKSASFKTFRKERGLSQDAFAALIGSSKRMVIRYERGETPIPRAIALACAAVAFGLPPME